MRLFRWGIEPKGRETTLSLSTAGRVVAGHAGTDPTGAPWIGLTILEPDSGPASERTFRTFEEDGEPIPPEWVFVIACVSSIQTWYVFEKVTPKERKPPKMPIAKDYGE